MLDRVEGERVGEKEGGEGRGRSWKEENYDEVEGKEEEKMGKERVKDS